MKYVEILGGIQTYVSNEENKILEMVRNGKAKYRDELNEYEVEKANILVKRGVLNRQEDDKGIFFVEVNTGI